MALSDERFDEITTLLEERAADRARDDGTGYIFETGNDSITRAEFEEWPSPISGEWADELTIYDEFRILGVSDELSVDDEHYLAEVYVGEYWDALSVYVED